MSVTGDMRSNGGFTLLELVVVLAVMALVAGLVIPTITGSSDLEVSTAARKIAGSLRLARSEAVNQNRDVLFELDVEQRSFRITSGPRIQLSNGIDLILYTAESELVSDDVGVIRFFADGSSTGGSILLRSNRPKSTVGRKVQIDWLAGRIAVSG